VNNLVTRTITGLIYGIVVIGSIILGKTSFATLGLIFTAIGLYEFFTIHLNNGLHPLRNSGVASGMALFLAVFFFADNLLDPKFFLFTIILFLALFVIEMYRNKTDPFANIAVTLLGIFYIAVPVSFMNLLVFPGLDGIYNPYTLIMIFGLIWAFDTGAYMSGVAFGKHRLFPRLSPKKSWEGVVGGVVLTILVALGISHFYHPVDQAGMVIMGLLTAIGATFGDLAESMLKRSMNIKDSGKLLPGHGGILDRIDSLLFVGPIIYVFLSFYR
jgi:phosphatidate cytidylyltransferase